MPTPDEVSSSWSRRKGRPLIKIVRSSEPAPILLSGASAAPIAQAPALARPHQVEEAVDVERHRRRRLAGQHQLEMPRRKRVLALEEKGPGELQADPHQLRACDQHGAEGGDRLVQQRRARVFRPARLLRRLDCREAVEEQYEGIDRLAPGQRPQYGQRLVEPAVPDQGSRGICPRAASAEGAAGVGAAADTGAAGRRKTSTAVAMAIGRRSI